MSDGSFGFECGLIIGRFQTFHLGHEHIVRCGLKVRRRVIIYIGSAQESGTEKNPFGYDLRRDIIASVFPGEVECGRLIIAPLVDAGLGNNSKWGKYVLDCFARDFGGLPDMFISGREGVRLDWFDGLDGLCELYVSKILDLSATRMRRALLDGDEEFFRENVNPALWGKYPLLRQCVLDSAGNGFTESI